MISILTKTVSKSIKVYRDVPPRSRNELKKYLKEFVDPAGGDFSFRPGSPALALGIEPLDVSKMGRRENN